VKRVLLCSGKAYFSLSQARKKEGIKDIAIVRTVVGGVVVYHA